MNGAALNFERYALGIMNRIAVIILVALGLASCAEKKSGFEEGPVELTGIAGDLPDHSEKTNCSGITVNGQEILFKGNYRAVPKEVMGKEIKVEGILKIGRLPMFIQDEPPGPGKEAIQGIPMPPGTDLEKESICYYIENPKWKVVE